MLRARHIGGVIRAMRASSTMAVDGVGAAESVVVETSSSGVGSPEVWSGSVDMRISQANGYRARDGTDKASVKTVVFADGRALSGASSKGP